MKNTTMFEEEKELGKIMKNTTMFEDGHVKLIWSGLSNIGITCVQFH